MAVFLAHRTYDIITGVYDTDVSPVLKLHLSR